MRTTTSSEENTCPCGPDCHCGEGKNCCCHGGYIHSGHRFWFWAIIRIIIVVLLIVGAFCAGVRLGFGGYIHGYGSYGFSDRGGYGMYPGMMQDYYDRYSRPIMRVSYPAQRANSSGQTVSGSIQ